MNDLIWWWQRLLCFFTGHLITRVITPYTKRCDRCRHYIKTGRKPRKRKRGKRAQANR